MPRYFLMFMLFITSCILFTACQTEGQAVKDPDEDQPKQTAEEKTKEESPPSPPDEFPHIQGIITKIEENTIFVEEDPNDGLGSQKATIYWDENTKFYIKDEDKYQIGKREDLKTDMEVEIWFTGLVKDTFPVEANSGHIVYIK